ncbi:MAG TPA: hypothetical protein VKP67_16210 [Xanthobacteraceae bacterium]|nr:hypothetical protein [Xanthobacteraceae bacterium]
MKANPLLYAMNAGEVSKIALARVDVAKLRMAAACQVNWLPYVVGPMSLRPGLYYVGEVLGDAPAKLVRFVFSKLDTALIELTANKMRVWVNEALVSRAAVATSIGDPFFLGLGSWLTANTTSGATATVGGGVCTLLCPPVGGLAQIQQTVTVSPSAFGIEHAIRIVVTQGPVVFRAGSTLGGADLIPQTTLDTGTHSLTFTPGSSSLCIQIEATDAWPKTLTSCAIEPAGPLVLPTPWGAADLPNIRYDQSGDIIFIGCYGQQQYKIERRAAHSWSTVLFYSNNGPFQASPGIQANFTPGAYSGNTTLTSDRPWFQPGHVGCLFRVFSNGQFNQTILGAQNAFTSAVRVTGVGSTRNYSWTTSGAWTGKLTFQRSYDSAASGFIDVSSATANGSPTFSSSTGGNTGTPDLDNVIAWERVGFKGGDYTSGNVTVTSTYAGGGGYGIFRVTGYNSPTSVNTQVLDSFSSLQATTDWVEGDWSTFRGFPTSVAFHEGRLCWFGGNQAWLSASDDFTNYADINLDGTATGDGGAINVTLGSGPVDTISWGLSLTRLMLGREQSIMSARSSNFDQPVTPTQIVIRDCSDQGAQRLPAIKAGKRGIYVQQSGRRVYELFFNAQEMDYDDRDLTRLNLDIGTQGFVDIDKTTQPDKMILLPRGDGQCAALLYDVKDEVEAWWRLQTLGVVENVAVLPQNGLEDLVYFVIRRTVNGVTRRFIERLAPRTNCVGGAINQQLDCHVVYQGAPVSTITLSHLPNTLVSVWADGQAIGSGTTNLLGVLTLPGGQAHSNIVAGLAGAVISNTTGAATATLNVGAQYNGYPAEVLADIGSTGDPVHVGAIVVTNGTITLPNGQTALTIIACLGYVAPFMSAKLAYAAQLGSALTQRKRIDHVGLVLYDANYQGISFGQRFDALDNLPLYEAGAATPAGTTWSEYDEPMIEAPGSWQTDARLCLLAQAPNPCTVGGVVIGLATNEKS